MKKIIDTFHGDFGSYVGKHYDAFVYSTALTYLEGDFKVLVGTNDAPSFSNVNRNVVVPHTAQFRSSGAQLFSDLGVEPLAGSSAAE